MPDFTSRSIDLEMMDDFSLDHRVINPIMNDLEVINKLLGGYALFFDAFKRLDLKNGMCISDWGCGGGDSLRVLSRWTAKRNLDLQFIGLDATASAVEYARNKAKSFPEISFMHTDVMSDDLKPQQFDIVISSLFTHHFEDQNWVKLIEKMLCCCKYAVIVNDLHRHWFAYHSIGFLTRLFSRSEMVKHDSQLSVLKGFRRQELESMLRDMGITNYCLKWKWAFRWQLIIYKQQNVAA